MATQGRKRNVSQQTNKPQETPVVETPVVETKPQEPATNGNVTGTEAATLTHPNPTRALAITAARAITPKFTGHAERLLGAAEDNDQLPCAMVGDMKEMHPIAPGANENWSTGLLALPYPDSVSKPDPKHPDKVVSENNADHYVAKTSGGTGTPVRSSFWKDYVANSPSGKPTVIVLDCVKSLKETGKLPEEHASLLEVKFPTGEIVTVSQMQDAISDDHAYKTFRKRFDNRLSRLLSKIKRVVWIAHQMEHVNGMKKLGCEIVRDKNGDVTRSTLNIRIGVKVTDKGEPFPAGHFGDRVHVTTGELLGYNVAEAEKKGGTIADLKASGKAPPKPTGQQGEAVKLVPSSAKELVAHFQSIAWYREANKDTAIPAVIEMIGVGDKQDDALIETIMSASMILQPLAHRYATEYGKIQARKKKTADAKREQEEEQEESVA